MQTIFIGMFVIVLLAAITGRILTAPSEGDSLMSIFLKSTGVKEKEEMHKNAMVELKQNNNDDRGREAQAQARDLAERTKEQLRRLKEQRSK